MNKVVRNERRKHTASFLNTVAAAFVTIGMVTPIVAINVGTSATSKDWTVVFAIAAVCSLVALALHFSGNGLLGGMEE